MAEAKLLGNWIIQHKETKRSFAIHIVEVTETDYLATNGNSYLRSEWDLAARCDASLVLP